MGFPHHCYPLTVTPTHGGWLFPVRSSFMISWVTPFSSYLFNVQSHFLFGNVWGFHGVEHAHQFSFLLFPFSSVLCSIDSGCDTVTDTETEDEKVCSCSKRQSLRPETSPGNLMVVQPDRIRCGVGASGPGLMSECGLSGFSVDAFVGVKGRGFSCCTSV